MAEDILHFTAVKLRVSGQGKLNMELLGLDDVDSFELIPLTLESRPGKQPTTLANLITQRAKLKLSTNKMNDAVVINRIILYAKPIYSSYPM